MRDTTGSAAAPAARCRNRRRGSFMAAPHIGHGRCYRICLVIVSLPRARLSRPVFGEGKKAKGPVVRPGLCIVSTVEVGLRRLFLDQFLGRLRPTPRALGKRRLDFLHRLRFGDVLHRRDLARQPVQRGFIELPFAVGLLGL